MAELLVRTVSKTSPNAFKDAWLTKRGDVIAAMPDGWGWCGDELVNPQWRILKWPAMSLDEADVFLSYEIATEFVPDPMRQIRGFNLNLDHGKLPKGMRKYLDDDTRQEPFFVVPDDFNHEEMKVKKPKRTNPHLFG